MRPSFFYGNANKEVAKKITRLINDTKDFLSDLTVNSPRAVGDSIQQLVANIFEDVVGDWSTEYSSEFARRAMQDIAFIDREEYYCVVDIKTHRADTHFNMPGLISVRRLADFYTSDKNIFSIMMIKYVIDEYHIKVQEVLFYPIEFFDWECLTIGNLGWGQIQIANSNFIKINDKYSRKKWMLHLCNNLLAYYPREINKIGDRMKKFEEIKEYWENKLE